MTEDENKPCQNTKFDYILLSYAMSLEWNELIKRLKALEDTENDAKKVLGLIQKEYPGLNEDDKYNPRRIACKKLDCIFLSDNY